MLSKPFMMVHYSMMLLYGNITFLLSSNYRRIALNYQMFYLLKFLKFLVSSKSFFQIQNLRLPKKAFRLIICAPKTGHFQHSTLFNPFPTGPGLFPWQVRQSKILKRAVVGGTVGKGLMPEILLVFLIASVVKGFIELPCRWKMVVKKYDTIR